MMIRKDENELQDLVHETQSADPLMSSWPVQALLGLIFMAFGIWFALYTGGTLVGTMATLFGGAFVLHAARTFVKKRTRS
ncbi:MAG: hypothetical protein OXR62_09745 [Ahrensia sp.]|nr:hypothetical protein [Ahrensia sp.]